VKDIVEAIVWTIGLTILYLIFWAMCTAPHAGCAAAPLPPVPPSVAHPFLKTAKELAAVSDLMGIIATISVLAIGLGIVLAVYIHTPMGPALALGGGVTLTLSILIKSTIWYVPWIAGGATALGLIAIVIDAIQKKSLLAAFRDVGDLFHENPPKP